MGGSVIADGQFFGRIRASVKVADLVLSETSYAAGAQVPQHAHESVFLCQVLQGGFMERSARVAKPCHAGSTLYHPAHEPHSHQFFNTTSRCFSIQLGRSWVNRLGDHGIPSAGIPRILSTARSSGLTMLLYQEFRRNDPASPLAIEGLTLALLAELSRGAPLPARSTARRRIAMARDIIEESFRQPLSLSGLAATVGVHPVHLSRAFRQEYGCTLTDYMRRLRLEYAAQQLSRSDDSVASIAFNAGFCDQGHFTRRFKEAVGLTPGAYRAHARQST